MIARETRSSGSAIQIAKRASRVATIAALLMSQAAFGAVEREGPSIHDTVQYHDITGNTEGELVAALKRISYAHPSGDSFFAANTHWQLSWNLSVQPSRSDCYLLSATTALDVKMNLPRWKAPTEADPDLVKRWNTFAAAVRKHEDGHRDIAIDAVREVAANLRNVRPTRDCASLKKNLNRVAQDTVREYREKEESYDVTTMHGRAQGASFP